jgi:hypothetical protein
VRSEEQLIQTGYGVGTGTVYRRKSAGDPIHHCQLGCGSDLPRGGANLWSRKFDRSWACTSSSKFTCNMSPSFHCCG